MTNLSKTNRQQDEPITRSGGIRLKTGARSGGLTGNHNQTVVPAARPVAGLRPGSPT